MEHGYLKTRLSRVGGMNHPCKNAITDIGFISHTLWVVSCSNHTHIRVWDLDQQSCIQIATSSASELWRLCFVQPICCVFATGNSQEFCVLAVTDGHQFDQTNPVVLTLLFKETRKSLH
jgi:hypothetical protein